MKQLSSKTLIQLVREKTETADTIKKYQQDYSSRRKRLVSGTSVEKHIPADSALKTFRTIYRKQPDKIDFDKIRLSDLADYIINVHQGYIRETLPRMLSYLGKVIVKHGAVHNELYRIADLFVYLAKELKNYLLNEEKILFPRIKQLEQNGFEPVPFDIKYYKYLRLPILNLKNDYNAAENTMNKLRILTGNYTLPPDAGNTYKSLFRALKSFETDLRQHIHLENNILFPKALILEEQLKLKSH